MKTILVLALFIACGSGSPQPAWHYDDKTLLEQWPALQTAFAARAAEDLGCDPSAVTVVVFTKPHIYGTGSAYYGELDHTGLAIAEGAGARVTYAVLPDVAAVYSNQPIPQTAFVLIARAPVVANTPTEPIGSAN
jgi:hypothetical protein